MSARIELNHRIHVLTRKEELDPARVAGKVVVVLDILFATTTMVAALAEGAREILPVLDESAARAAAAGLPQDSYLLSGELYAETLPGFVQPTPLALVRHGVAGKRVIYSTTNGTVAIRQSAHAARVYCGSLLNTQRIAEHLVSQHAEAALLVVCAGSGANFNLEDFYGAGYLVDCLVRLLGADADLSDAARCAASLYREARVPQALLECRVGRLMSRRGLAHEVEFACRFDAHPIVPALEGDRLRIVA